MMKQQQISVVKMHISNKNTINARSKLTRIFDFQLDISHLLGKFGNIQVFKGKATSYHVSESETAHQDASANQTNLICKICLCSIRIKYIRKKTVSEQQC